MAYTHLLYHIVFCPKNRMPAINIGHEELLYRYIWGFIKSSGCILYRIGGMPDHIHILVQIPPTITVADFVRNLKVSSGNFLKEHRDEFPQFAGWGRSYCAVTCSYDRKDAVIRYISGQKEHHKRVTFQDELQQWLRETGIEAEEKYLLTD